jgi:hypothetical protein
MFDSTQNIEYPFTRSSKRQRLLILVGLLLVTRLADIGSTWLATPALSHEANPLVAVLGLGWDDFLKWQLACVLMAVFSILYTIKVEQKLMPREPGLDLLSFVSRVYYRRPWHWANFLYSVPRDSRTSLYLLNYTFSRGLILTGIFAATWNVSLYLFLNGRVDKLGAIVHVLYPLGLFDLPQGIVQVASLPLLLAVLFAFVYAAFGPYQRYRVATDRHHRSNRRAA